MKKTKIIPPDYIQIPYQIIIDKDLTPADKFIYGSIYWFTRMRGDRCFASNSAIGAIVGVSAGATKRAINKLDESKYILRLFADVGRRHRTEIIPLVSMQKTSSKKYKLPILEPSKNTSSDAQPRASKTVKQMLSPEHQPKKDRCSALSMMMLSPEHDDAQPGASPILDLKTPQKPQNEAKTDQNGGKLDAQPRAENKSKVRAFNKSIKEYYPVGPSDTTGNDNISNSQKTDHFGGSENGKRFTDKLTAMKKFNDESEIPETMVADTIALFLPVFPQAFITKQPFAIPATRNAVKQLLMRLTIPEIKNIIDKYLAGKSDKYRPSASTIYDFCVFKITKIEDYVSKSAGGLWAHKSISTPEQSAVRDEQYNKRIEESREKTRKAKEEWEKTHPQEINGQ